MVTFYDNYSSLEFQTVTEQLKLSEFVHSQTAQIEARPIVQMSSAQNDEAEIVQMPSAGATGTGSADPERMTKKVTN